MLRFNSWMWILGLGAIGAIGAIGYFLYAKIDYALYVKKADEDLARAATLARMRVSAQEAAASGQIN